MSELQIDSISIPAEEKRKKYNNQVRFNDGTEWYFSQEELFRYGIYAGRRIGEQEWNALLGAIEEDRAYAAGLHILLYKKNTRLEVKQKLKRKAYGDSAVDAALIRLEEAGYIDDKRYTENYFKACKMQKYKSMNQGRKELLRKGVDADIIAEVLSEYEEETLEDEICKMKQFMNNKYTKLIHGDSIEYNRIIGLKRTLYNKGYSMEAIQKVLGELAAEKMDGSKYLGDEEIE